MIVYILVNIIQLIGICVPFVGCVSLIRKANNRVSMYLLLANLGCLIINASYLLLLQSKSFDSAMAALKMEYFGNVVFYLMFGLFLWTYMKMKPYKWAIALVSFWGFFDVLFLILLWSGDRMHLIFERLNFEWHEKWGLVMLKSDPGIFYLIYYCIICMIVFCSLIYITVRMMLVEIRSERRNLIKLVGAQFVIGISLVLMMLFNFSFDIVPIFASTSILSIIISIRRNEFFSIKEVGREWVFDQMGDAFILVDELYGYLDSNTYAKKIFTELDSKRKNEIVSGELLTIFLNGEKIQHIQGKYYNKKIMEMREKGAISGYSLLLVDITEQYELMERVREEKERADEANQAKSAFVSNVSHEIRTPMNAIVGMTQILLRRELPKQEKEYLMNIQNSGNALLAIVNDLLDMSKIESGKMELVDEEYDFMSMLSDLGMIILNRIGSKPVELLFDIDTDVPAKLYGDALRIRQIIINLMNNATKFTEEGYVCLTVKVNRIEKEDIELFLSVKDSGQGIKEEDLGKLFGSFQQVDTKKNHHKEGTGLGLSISKQLVELMNGSIGVTSEYGKGSEFYFTIHQQIVDGARAARISGDTKAVIIGNMKNALANDLLKKLALSYNLNYTEDVMTVEKTELPVFCFTDRYEVISEEEKQKLSTLGAVVCGMQNPMVENEQPDHILTMNKPLYSHNFCNLIENGRNMAESRPIREIEEKTSAPEEFKTEFLATDACVLVVDDNEINRMVAEEMLKPLDMRIETAPDGKRALEMIRSKKYDLIFMDHLMPVMNGVEAVKELRNWEEDYYKKVPVIALTANTAKEQKAEYLQAGMSDYLSKPIDMEDIYKIVRKWIPDKISVAGGERTENNHKREEI